MDSSVSMKDQVWFLRVCHHVSNVLLAASSQGKFVTRRIKTYYSVALEFCSCGSILNINHLNAELKPICHLLALLGAHHILHVSRIRVKVSQVFGVQIFCTSVKQVDLQWVILQHKEIITPIFFNSNVYSFQKLMEHF